MSDATGAGGLRDSPQGPEHELSGWPADEQQLRIGGGSDDALPTSSRNEGLPDTSAGPDDDIRGMSYEAARDALVKVVDELERGGTTLERSLALWERGEALAARCESWLTGARARLEAARAGAQARSGG